MLNEIQWTFCQYNKKIIFYLFKHEHNQESIWWTNQLVFFVYFMYEQRLLLRHFIAFVKVGWGFYCSKVTLKEQMFKKKMKSETNISYFLLFYWLIIQRKLPFVKIVVSIRWLLCYSRSTSLDSSIGLMSRNINNPSHFQTSIKINFLFRI